MHPVDHAQAVEAAKCPDCGNTMENAIPHGSPGLRRCANCKNVFPILSAPGPSRDAATAEQCRAFVWRLMAASMRHAATRGEGEAEREAMAESFAAELLAMFAGGTGDDEIKPCPKCRNSTQNATPHGSPKLLRCASCKTVFDWRTGTPTEPAK